ncbi:MAG TPA: hypothetical protein VF278_00325 [Pirellulales bacterium]
MNKMVVGRYARPDVFQLTVNEGRTKSVRFQKLSENSSWGGPPARLEANDGSASHPTMHWHGEMRVFG